MVNDQQGRLGVGMRAVKGVRVSYHHPVHVMDVRKCGDAYQIRHKEYQQAHSAYNFILLLHVREIQCFFAPQK